MTFPFTFAANPVIPAMNSGGAGGCWVNVLSLSTSVVGFRLLGWGGTETDTIHFMAIGSI